MQPLNQNPTTNLSRHAVSKFLDRVSVKRIRWTLLTTIVCLGTWATFNSPIFPDVGWYLYAAEQICLGEQLYVDLFVPTPPLIIWFCCLPLTLAIWSHTPVDIAFHGTVLGLCVTSIHMCSQAIYTLTRGFPAQRILLEAVVAILFLLGAGSHFGEIEHLVFVCMLPCILMLAIRIRILEVSTAYSSGIGLLAAFGVSFDLRIAALWVVTVSIIGLRSRSIAFRTENLLIASGLIGMVTCTSLFAPGYYEQLQWPTWVELGVWAKKTFYGVFHPAFQIIFLNLSLALLLSRKMNTMSLPLFLAASSGLLWFVSVAQATDNPYALYPSMGTVTLASALIVLQLLNQPRTRRGFPWSLATGAALPIALILCIAGTQVFTPPERLDLSGDGDASGLPLLEILESKTLAEPILL
jgi:hypothetical protein